MTYRVMIVGKPNTIQHFSHHSGIQPISEESEALVSTVVLASLKISVWLDKSSGTTLSGLIIGQLEKTKRFDHNPGVFISGDDLRTRQALLYVS